MQSIYNWHHYKLVAANQRLEFQICVIANLFKLYQLVTEHSSTHHKSLSYNHILFAISRSVPFLLLGLSAAQIFLKCYQGLYYTSRFLRNSHVGQLCYGYSKLQCSSFEGTLQLLHYTVVPVSWE